MLEKLFKVFVAAVVFIGLATAPVVAEVVNGSAADTFLGAADEVTDSLRVNAKGSNVTVFINGTYVATAWLQKEVGSPGSGAWEDVIRVTNGTDNATVRTYVKTDRASTSWRVRADTYTSGAIAIQLFDGRLTPTEWTASDYRDRVRIFDDLTQETFAVQASVVPGRWLTFIETQGTVGDILLTEQEGAMDMTAGTGGTITQDVVAISYGVVANTAALVSLGPTVVEYRFKTSGITGTAFGFGLSDTVAVNAAIATFVMNTNIVTDTGSTNDIIIGYSSDADATTAFQAASTNAGTVGNNDDEMESTHSIAVDTYYVLRIEVDANGDAYFYVDSALFAVEPLALATTARMIPYIFVTSATDDTTGGAVITVDYVDFIYGRPDGN